MSKQDLITAALAALQPEHLEVLDESHMHSRGLETHYKAVIVSPAFAGLNAVKRHQKVYATVGELMGQIHALALHLSLIHIFGLRQWQRTLPGSVLHAADPAE